MVMLAALVFVTDAHGVQVSLRNDTACIELVADGGFAASPERVLAVILDYERSPLWQKQLGESRVLSRGARALDVYQRLKLPIISDRDYTLHVTWGEDERGVWLRFSAANERGPAPRSGVVRVPVHQGVWRLERVSDGRATRAHYEVKVDLGGSVPAGMARGRIAKDIPEYFEGLRRQL